MSFPQNLSNRWGLEARLYANIGTLDLFRRTFDRGEIDVSTYHKQHKVLLTDIIEKPGEGKEPSKLVNLVCHIFNDFSKFTKYLKEAKSKKDDKYEIALNNYVKKGKARMLAHTYKGQWRAIKYPWHILYLMNQKI